MGISIIKAGLCDTMQDLGRFGHGAYGINSSGAMDILSMQTANALVLNELPAAVLEMHFPAPVIRFDIAAFIALSGADFNAVVTDTNGISKNLPADKTAFVPAGAVLSFTRKQKGERCYLALHGGFDLTPWLGSNSTQLKVKAGGYMGRALQKHDHISLRKHISYASSLVKLFPWSANFYSWYEDPQSVNYIPGPEYGWLDDASKKSMLQIFTVDAHSDRMGILLTGNALRTKTDQQLISSGVAFGTMQLLPNGNIVVLAADHPTTGGYPRIGNIISAHLPKLVQSSAGSPIRLLPTTVESAAELLFLQQQELKQLQSAIRLHMQHLIA